MSLFFSSFASKKKECLLKKTGKRNRNITGVFEYINQRKKKLTFLVYVSSA